MEENVIHINGGITINVDVNIKNVMHVKKIIFEILQHVVVKIEKYLAGVIDYSAITRNEIIESYDEDADADAEAKSNNKKMKRIKL